MRKTPSPFHACRKNGRIREQKQVCGECRGGLVFDPESGEQICRVCGVVSEPSFDPFIPSSYVAPPKSEQPESRMAYDLHLATLIGRDDRDAGGRPIQTNLRVQPAP